nr:ferritin family protein [uncultured Desulfobulbus sp.]
MFTLADVRNIAVQIEKNGEETYRKVAAQVKSLELQQIFQWMADEEKRHGEVFAAIIDDRTLSKEQAELEAMGRSLLEDIVRSQTFSLDEKQLVQTTNLDDLLAQSIEFEQDTIDFYQFLAGFLDEPEAISQLNRIVEQEQAHVKHLQEIRSNATSLADFAIEL